MSAYGICRLAGSAIYVIAILAFLNGCATLPSSSDSQLPPAAGAPTPPVESPIPAATPSPVETPSPIEATVPREMPGVPDVVNVPMQRSVPERVSILLSDDNALFLSVTEEIEQRLGETPYTIHNLDGDPQNSADILSEVKGSHPQLLIAIGLLAADLGRQLDDVPMVFCYVFNHEDHDLVSTKSKGVSFLPPFEAQLEAWREYSPDLHRVGVIIGPNQDALATEIREAADKVEIELQLRTVSSDQEALYEFRRLIPDIQGLWLPPDNRILSPRIVRDIMSYAERHQIQIVVFSRRMLRMGAVIAITSRSSDIADQVVAQLEHRTEDGQLTGPDTMPLTQMDVSVNRDVARAMGMLLSEHAARSE